MKNDSMIYRVELTMGYNDYYFDFRESIQAIEFMKIAYESFNKERTDVRKFKVSVALVEVPPDTNNRETTDDFDEYKPV